MKSKPDAIYCTSYCNFGHRVRTGRPVGHECYVLPPAMLRAERDGDIERANKILHAHRARHGTGRTVVGRARLDNA